MTFKRFPIKFITKNRSSYEQFKVGDTAYSDTLQKYHT